jgi:CelD/BcsL family acetyltransferase involved in cellulose biosynthesis
VIAQSHSLQIHLIRDTAALLAVRIEWEALYAVCLQRAAFLRWSWIELWWRTYAPPRSELRILCARDAAGALVGIAPLYLRATGPLGFGVMRRLCFIGTGTWIKTSEYLDILSRPGMEQPVASAVASWIASAADWNWLWLWHVPAQSPLATSVSSALDPSLRPLVCDEAHYVDTAISWDEYLGSVGHSMRKSIRHRTNRIERMEGFQFRRAPSDANVEELLAVLISLHGSRWNLAGQPGSFELPGFEQFLREALTCASAEGAMRAWTITIEGKTAAVLVGFLSRGTFHYFQSGFAARYSRHSIGLVLIGLCLRDCCESSDVREFDFMGGGAAYKRHWSRAVHRPVQVEYFRSRLLAWLYPRLRSARPLVGRLLPDWIRRLLLRG